MKKIALYFGIFEFLLIGITGSIVGLGLHVDGAFVIGFYAFWCALACGIELNDIYKKERKARKEC